MTQPYGAAALAVAHSRASAVVGRFHFGMVDGTRLMVLTTWRVVSMDLSVTDRLVELFGGRIHRRGDGLIEAILDISAVDALVCDRGARIYWQRDDSTPACTFQQAGSHCRCGTTVAERRRVAQQGEGCEPRAILYFRLHDAPSLGMFRFVSRNWSFAEEVEAIDSESKRFDDQIRVRLGLERTAHRLGSGALATYTRPTIQSTGRAV